MFEKDKNKGINKKTVNDKVIKKCLDLLDRGHSIENCLERFPAHRKELDSFLKILKNLGNIGNIKAGINLEDAILKKVYQSNSRTDEEYGNNYDTGKIRVRPSFLKPAVVFLSVFMFFSLSFAGTVYASENSLPGDTLYGVKKIYEDVQIAFTPYSNEGKLYYNFLSKRIDETDILLGKEGPINEEDIENLLGEIDFNYGKCIEHRIFADNDSEIIGKHIYNLRQTFRERCGTDHNPGDIDANSNQYMEQQHGNMGQNQEPNQNNNNQNQEQNQQSDCTRNVISPQGSDNQYGENQSVNDSQNSQNKQQSPDSGDNN